MKPYVSVITDDFSVDAICIVSELRREKLPVQYSWNGKIKSQLKRAEADWIVLSERGELKLRNARCGKNQLASKEEIIEGLKDLFLNNETEPTPLIGELLE